MRLIPLFTGSRSGLNGNINNRRNRQIRKRVYCPEYGKDLDSVGLSGHRYYAHQILYPRHQMTNLAANDDLPNVQKEAKFANYFGLADTIAGQSSALGELVSLAKAISGHDPQLWSQINEEPVGTLLSDILL
jgi:hypothetical protein